MRWDAARRLNNEITFRQTAAWLGVGVVCFHLSYNFRGCSFLMLVYICSLTALVRQPTSRRSFYFGISAALLAYAPQLSCFYTIFGSAAAVLWLVLAFWIGIFGLLGRLCLLRFGLRWGLVVLPFLWTGLEYFRSELYYLRFSWLNAGYAFSDHVQFMPFGVIGVYGVGFLLMLLAAAIVFLSINLPSRTNRLPAVSCEVNEQASKISGFLILCTSLGLLGFGLWTSRAWGAVSTMQTGGVKVAGVQMEFPGDVQVIFALNKLKKDHPDAPLLVLSEYTFTESLSDVVRKWCLRNERYLIVGGKDFVGEAKFYDTAFVIDPHGEIVFRQAKSVPIQFFNDGLPASNQKLWESPWGRIGICICYDLSYTRVTDALVRLGAQALIVPTMDVVDWGRREHELHSRIAPIRAAEYGLPIFRVASSGISQLVDRHGLVMASAPFPGEDAVIAGWLEIAQAGRLPLDRALAKSCVLLTAMLMGWLAVCALKKSPSKT